MLLLDLTSTIIGDRVSYIIVAWRMVRSSYVCSSSHKLMPTHPPPQQKSSPRHVTVGVPSPWTQLDDAGLDKHYAQLSCSRAISPKTPAQSPVPPYKMKTMKPCKAVQQFRAVLCCDRHPQTKVKTERGLIVGIVQPLSVARVPHWPPSKCVSPDNR